MNIRELTPRYSVSPQIAPDDVAAIKAAGFAKVICNRPDEEVPPSHQSQTVRTAIEAAGLAFEVLPLTHQTMTPDNIARQKEMIASAGGPVLAYCASGTRSSIIWALGQAGELPVDQILATTTRAGYALDGLRPTLDALSAE